MQSARRADGLTASTTARAVEVVLGLDPQGDVAIGSPRLGALETSRGWAAAPLHAQACFMQHRIGEA